MTNSSAAPQQRKRPRPCLSWLMPASILAVAGFLRMAWLWNASYRADTILFLDICSSPAGLGELWRDWLRIAGETSQFPFAVWLAKAFVLLVHQPVGPFWIALPSALMGTATVYVFYRAAQVLGGRWFACYAAALLALNPFHIQMTREAYFYPPLVLGAALLLWATVALAGRQGWNRWMGWSFHAVFLGGVIFAAYSHFSGWWLCVPVVAIMAGLSYRRFRHGRPYRADAAVMLGGLVLVGLPLLLADWGVPFFVKVLTTPAMKEHAQSVMGINQLSALSMTWQIGTAMGWGDTALRSCFLVGSLLALPVALYLRPLQRRKAGVVLFVTVVAMVIYLAANKQQGAYFARRHASLVLPGFLILAAYALWEVRLIGRRLTGVSRKAWTVGWGLVLAASLLLNMRPAVACARLDGNPSPYTRIRDWIEAELPAGTVVLVDRWLEPWNELRHYAPSNAQYTFTVPNEPWTAYLQNRWRESVVGFFEKYPEAAYMPLCGSYTNDPNLGTWDWPDKHFARRHSITNAEGFILRDLGLAYREDFYTVGWTRLVADIFYNTRADVIAAARASGRPTLALCGPGWGYTKLWRQMPGDFRDWRVLGDRATVDLYNLTAAPTNVTLAVRAVAVGAATRVRASTGADQFFPAGQLQDWSIRGIVLQPGSNAVQLVRAGHGGPNAAVLVEAIRVQ